MDSGTGETPDAPGAAALAAKSATQADASSIDKAGAESKAGEEPVAEKEEEPQEDPDVPSTFVARTKESGPGALREEEDMCTLR
jgi:hypothetical protein